MPDKAKLAVELRKESYRDAYYIVGTDILHRDDGPSSECYREEGTLSYYTWSPAQLEVLGPSQPSMLIFGTDENGVTGLRRALWLQGSARHRTSGPAVIDYDENGKVASEQWYVDDRALTDDGVADMKLLLALDGMLGDAQVVAPVVDNSGDT